MKIYKTDGGEFSWSSSHCDKCGKPFIYIGDVPPGGFTKGLEPYCTCYQGNKINIHSAFPDLFKNQGWTCPKCGRVFAPHIVECLYCNGVSVSSVWMTSSSSGSDTYSRTQNTYADTKDTYSDTKDTYTKDRMKDD